MMNAGASSTRSSRASRRPAQLADRPYLSPIYDEPEFVVRNLYRLYGGWWDGNPAHLKPAREAALAGELARLAGGPGALAIRARELARQGRARAGVRAGRAGQPSRARGPHDPRASVRISIRVGPPRSGR